MIANKKWLMPTALLLLIAGVGWLFNCFLLYCGVLNQTPIDGKLPLWVVLRGIFLGVAIGVLLLAPIGYAAAIWYNRHPGDPIGPIESRMPSSVEVIVVSCCVLAISLGCSFAILVLGLGPLAF